MTKLQALTVLRDAVAMTRGVHAGMWYNGKDKHCTIGAIVQVAVDVGFPLGLARHMMDTFATQCGNGLRDRVVSTTDGTPTMTPVKRRTEILGWLENEIAVEREHAPALPTPADVIDREAGQEVSVADLALAEA